MSSLKNTRDRDAPDPFTPEEATRFMIAAAIIVAVIMALCLVRPTIQGFRYEPPMLESVE